jgi:outer membrane protein TolC
MNRRSFATAAAAAAALLTSASASVTMAQQPPPAVAEPATVTQTTTPRELTLDQAVAAARKANRNLVVERARLAQAQTTVEQAWATLFPTVSALGKYTRNNTAVPFVVMGQPVIFQPLNQFDGAVSASMPVLAPAAYPALDAVKKGVASAEANVEASEASILYSVGQTFYTAAISDEVLVARRSSVEVARATLANAQTRLTAGTVTKVDVDRAELALVRAEQDERDAHYASDQSYRALSTLIQVPGPFVVRTPPEPSLPQGSDAEDFGLALHLRPELRALELSVEGYEAQADAQAWRWAPTLSAFGNGRIFNYKNFALQQHAWAVGLQLDILIYDGGARDAARHLANAQAAEARARAQVLQDSIHDDIANARADFINKDHARQAATRSVELSKETLDLVRTQYEAGSATQLDLLQAQDNLVGSQVTLARAHFDVAVADLTLRRANGTFPGK